MVHLSKRLIDLWRAVLSAFRCCYYGKIDELNETILQLEKELKQVKAEKEWLEKEIHERKVIDDINGREWL